MTIRLSTTSQSGDLTAQQLDHSALPPKARILVAVSGGADSVALLHLLHGAAKQYHWRLTVAHLNHGIRGKMADGDAAFVSALARRLRLPCVVGRSRVPALAKRRGVSLEMAAREARYAFLVKTARRVKADVIATAHTADDQVETILLKLVRGAGRGGLSGMDDVTAFRGVRIARPLLQVSRDHIEGFLRRRLITWREDETNDDPAFLRNRVRRELLPLLERNYNPAIRETLLRTRDVLAAEEEWMDQAAHDLLREGPLEVSGLLKAPLAARRRVIRLWLVRQGLPESCLDYDGVERVGSLLDSGRTGKRVDLPGGWRVKCEYGRLSLHRGGVKNLPWKSAKVQVPGVTLLRDRGLRIRVSLAPGIVKDRSGVPGRLPARATLDAAVLGQHELRIRSLRAGDRIAPFGMRGSRKLQDILVDAKVRREDRAGIPVLECEGEVVWLPGYRIARRWAVADEGARNVQITIAGC